MDTIGVDLHKRETQLCIGQADGTITEQRIVTSRERFTAVLGTGRRRGFWWRRVPRASGWPATWNRWAMR